MRSTPIIGKGITMSTTAKSIKPIRHFVFMVISKTHFHIAQQRCHPSSHPITLEATLLPKVWHLSRGSTWSRPDTREGEEISSRENEAETSRFKGN